jgi:drug/metabolite transporter (DMT)-like permease
MSIFQGKIPMSPSNLAMLRMSPHVCGGAYGLAAAALFGMSPPIAKLLLPEANPLLLAGLLYCGAGLGLLGFEVLFYRKSKASQRESAVRAADYSLLAGIILTGGILGPVCMLWGLQCLSAVGGSLFLNLEAPFTSDWLFCYFESILVVVRWSGRY